MRTGFTQSMNHYCYWGVQKYDVSWTRVRWKSMKENMIIRLEILVKFVTRIYKFWESHDVM